MQAALASDKDTSFVVTVLLDGFESSHCGTSSVSDTAKDRLIIHAGTTGKLRGAESECRCASLSNDEVAGLEELAQSLGLC